MDFIEARWKTVLPGRQIDLIVWHRMEAADKPGTARGTGNFFANLPSDRKASAHYGFDSSEGIQYVLEKDVAYHAPGANSRGLGFELAGYSADSDWANADNEAMLRLACAQAAEDVQRYGIPNVFRGWQDLLAGGDRARGHTTHWEVTQAFHQSDHTDPGPYFPMQHVIDLVAQNAPGHTTNDVYTLVQGADDLPLSPNAGVGNVNVVECGLGTDPRAGYELTADGGIRTHGGATLPAAPGIGNYLGLPDEDRQGSRFFIDISPNEDGSPGYTLWSSDGGRYVFGPGKLGW